MPESLYTSIHSRLKKHLLPDNYDLYMRIVTFAVVIFCFVIHIYLLILFLCTTPTAFIYINLGSILIYCFLLLLIKKRKYTVVGILISLEVSIYALLTCILSNGLSSYIISYYMLVVIMQIMLPYGSPRIRLAMVAVTVLFTTVGIIIDLNIPPQIVFEPWFHNLFMISNIYILFIGTIAQLYTGDIVGNIISRFNLSRMEELSNQANTDPLTKLYNRRYADTFFEKEFYNKLQSCVAMIDIDNFKLINDQYGHGCGDEVLKFLSKFLTVSLRKSDIIFRWGGEEFLVVLDGADLKTAYQVLDNVRLKLASTDIHTSKCTVRITVTIGASLLDPKDPFGSIDQSDSRMYEGKKDTKNVVVI